MYSFKLYFAACGESCGDTVTGAVPIIRSDPAMGLSTQNGLAREIWGFRKGDKARRTARQNRLGLTLRVTGFLAASEIGMQQFDSRVANILESHSPRFAVEGGLHDLKVMVIRARAG
jgi:hypothetical protein